jgi:hypothetical protein
MNKRRPGEAVLRGALARAEAAARAVNVEPWAPPPGMERRLCRRCRYWFAAAEGSQDIILCPTCARSRRPA